MPLILNQREPDLTEWMDQPDCDRDKLFNTYRQFETINKLLSGWRSIFHQFLKPVIEANNGSATLLDIGCGGGDIIRYLDQLCRKNGYLVDFTGLDPDPRAKSYFVENTESDRIRFLDGNSRHLTDEGHSYDVVISNHLLHHLQDHEVQALCRDAERLGKHLVLFNDIERSDIGYGLFAITTPLLFRRSYISPDGKRSIRRSFRKKELQKLLPDNWHVNRQFPFRLLAVKQNHDI
jgi:2-polyprenyl-3-methyl-5-hydroxy-6-metoxy-1,4-benzoquinol methylase